MSRAGVGQHHPSVGLSWGLPLKLVYVRKHGDVPPQEQEAHGGTESVILACCTLQATILALCAGDAKRFFYLMQGAQARRLAVCLLEALKWSACFKSELV